MERKQQRAEEIRQQQLNKIVRKAHDEDSKVNEILFINKLEAQNKSHDILSKEKDREMRLQDLHDERQRRLEEKQAKEAAVEERRKVLEEERRQRIHELQRRRRLKDMKIENRMMAKEKERQEMANQKVRHRQRSGSMVIVLSLNRHWTDSQDSRQSMLCTPRILRNCRRRSNTNRRRRNADTTRIWLRSSRRHWNCLCAGRPASATTRCPSVSRTTPASGVSCVK